MMKKVKAAASPDAYVARLKGWRQALVKGQLARKAVALNRTVGNPTR